ncbi:winged helix DNA-binding domain-containing protein [Nocardia sp. NPDC055053]
MLALHARVEDVTAEHVDHLVGEEKSLLQTWCMRGSPFFFPTADAAVFTTGVLPTAETARQHLIRGIVCLAPRSKNTAPFVLLGEWLGTPLPHTDPATTRATLLRRYLRCYGPSTRKDFAAWLGIDAGDVDPWWTSVADELTPVEVDGSRAWIHIDDLPVLHSPPAVHGVRMLPPSDPYTQMRDRNTIVDPKHQRAVWKTVGAPGTVLADGVITGIWRPRKKGRTLTLTVTTFRSMNSRLSAQLRAEAASVAALRGATDVHVEFDVSGRG